MLNTAAEIVTYLGKANIAAKLGIGVRAVEIAVDKGALPAHWYDTLEGMAGRPLGRGAFTFKRPVSNEAAE